MRNKLLKSIENANIKRNAVCDIYSYGQEKIKDDVLAKVLPYELAKLHNECVYHIHDLEYYEITYNCLGLSVKDVVDDISIGIASMLRKLYRGIVDLSNRQSGGIGFINFDEDVAAYISEETDEELKFAFKEFFCDLNSLSRKGCEPPYVTINLGLCTTEKGRRVDTSILDAFFEGDDGRPFVFPNLVFKLKKGVNTEKNDRNHDILQKAFMVTSKCMIPTYLNLDTCFNKIFDEKNMGIMGCRTRIASNLNGEEGALNRGNIASITINLPQLAYKAQKSIDVFYSILDYVLDSARELLLHRFETLAESSGLEWIANKKYYLGYEDFFLNDDKKAMLRNGTLAIGFIGLWDAVGIMHNGIKDVEDIERNFKEGWEIVKRIRNYTDKASDETGLNFSVLATAAEGTTGRFAKYDQKHLGNNFPECEKGYYSNSFHIPVELKVPYWKKCELEGPFHALCNGGAITYIEFFEMPYRNVLAVQMAVETAYKEGCGYIGINFPLDVCDSCGYTGRLSDYCPECFSKKIKRFRRVSGYLAEESYFTVGKKAEMKRRITHF